MFDEFRVIHTDISALPGVPAQVTAAFGEIVAIVRCDLEDIDPPHYQKLKRVVARSLLPQIERRLEDLVVDQARTSRELEFLLEVAGEESPDKRVKAVAKAARGLAQRKLKREEEAEGLGE